ncbi:MAG: hypothetical protein JWP81_1170 [Ferruginibacter sp.]|nr:hypothetical protein [Ferruginibacter sp.]
MKTFKYYTLLLALLIHFHAFSQKNLAEKLGYAKDTKLLIIHADDVGLSHSEDSATITAFKKGAITSASIMVPCPWFPEIAAYAKQHPEMDWGIHLTFTSEWKNYRWDGVAPSGEIPGMIGMDGYLYASVEDFAKHATPGEVEKEIRAEIEKAKFYGIKLTHLDNHMGSILASPEMVKIYQQLGKEYQLPVLIPMNMIQMMAPQLLKYIDTNAVVVVNNFVSAYPAVPVGKWKEFYGQAIQNLKPGLNEMIFHLAYDDDEMQAITIEHAEFGSAWRQRDLDYVLSAEFKSLLKSNNVQLITWGDVQRVMYKK